MTSFNSKEVAKITDLPDSTIRGMKRRGIFPPSLGDGKWSEIDALAIGTFAAFRRQGSPLESAVAAGCVVSRYTPETLRNALSLGREYVVVCGPMTSPQLVTHATAFDRAQQELAVKNQWAFAIVDIGIAFHRLAAFTAVQKLNRPNLELLQN